MEVRHLILAILTVFVCLLPLMNDQKFDRAKKSLRSTPLNAVIAEDVTLKDLKERADDQNDRNKKSSRPALLSAVIVEDEALKELRRNAFLLKFLR